MKLWILAALMCCAFTSQVKASGYWDYSAENRGALLSGANSQGKLNCEPESKCENQVTDLNEETDTTPQEHPLPDNKLSMD